MSSRRKRAPPVRVDEEAKKRLNWNMLEDRKNEEVQEDEEIPTCSILSADPAPSSTLLSPPEAATEAACTPVLFTEELPNTSSDITAASTSLALTVFPLLKLSHIWKALIGEFSVRPAWLPSDCDQRAFTFHRMGEQLCISYSSCDESSGVQCSPDEDTCTAECSLRRIPLEDLDWLQKRRVVQLCHQAKDDSVKVYVGTFTGTQRSMFRLDFVNKWSWSYLAFNTIYFLNQLSLAGVKLCSFSQIIKQFKFC